jgi:hypothetical protein
MKTILRQVCKVSFQAINDVMYIAAGFLIGCALFDFYERVSSVVGLHL